MAELVTKNIIDRTFAAARAEAEPWNVHAEWVVGGRVDGPRLLAAAEATVHEYPLLSAREHDEELWLIRDEPSPPVVGFWSVAGHGALDEVRGLLVSRAFDLRRLPPVRFDVVHAPDGDHVVVVADHALVDGVGIGRLAVSLMTSYTSGQRGEVDTHWREAHALGVAVPPGDRIKRTVEELRLRAVPTAARLAAEHAGESALGERTGESHEVEVPRSRRDGRGHEVVYHDLSPVAAGRLASVRRSPWTANDIVVTAFCVAGMDWNRQRGRPAAPFSVGVPLNLRPARSWFQGVCNATLPWPVRVDDLAPAEVLRQVSDQLRPVRAGLCSPDVRAVLTHLAGQRRLSVRERHGLATTTVVSSVPGADVARVHLPARVATAAVYGGAPATRAMGITFAVAPDADAFRLSARYLRSRYTAAGVAGFLSSVDAAVVAVCELVCTGSEGSEPSARAEVAR